MQIELIEQQTQVADEQHRLWNIAARIGIATGSILLPFVHGANTVEATTCAPGETVVPIYETDANGNLIIVSRDCVVIPGSGGNVPPNPTSPPNPPPSTTPSVGNQQPSDGNNSSPAVQAPKNTTPPAPIWDDIKAFVGCVPETGDAAFADQLINAGVTQQGKRLVDLIQNCPAIVWQSLISNPQADITVSPEAQAAMDQYYVDLAAPATTVVETALPATTTTEVPTNTDVSTTTNPPASSTVPKLTTITTNVKNRPVAVPTTVPKESNGDRNTSLAVGATAGLAAAAAALLVLGTRRRSLNKQ